MKLGTLVAVAVFLLGFFEGAAAQELRASGRTPPFADSTPKWSPDGSAVAFHRASVVHVVPAAGGRLEPTETRPLAPIDWWVSWYDWAPKGSVVGVLAWNYGRGHLLTTDGRIRHSTRPWFCPRASWSSDASLLAYSWSESSGCNLSTLRVVNREGEIVREVTGSGPVFSPDGRYLAFHRYGDARPGARYAAHSTWVYDMVDRVERQVLSVGEYALWSPDSTSLAVLDDGPSTVPEPYSEYAVYIVKAHGMGARKVGVVNRALYQRRPMPSWSPDSRRLAYNALTGIHVVDADGQVVRNVGHGILEGWSPRNEELLVVQRGRVEVVGVDRKRAFIGRGIAASWSRDGERIAFVGSLRCGPRQGIWTATRTGTGRKRLTNACPVTGGAGRDVLLGTLWRDTVHAYDSDDTVRVRGGGRDIVFCGDGRDVVIADRLDRVIDCERVERR